MAPKLAVPLGGVLLLIAAVGAFRPSTIAGGGLDESLFS